MRYSPSGPLLPFSLLVVWLLLTQDLSFANVTLGLLAACLITVGTALLRPLRSRPKRLLTAVALCWQVLVDIVYSNLGVARLILSGTRHPPRAGFVKIPLDLRDPHGLAMLTVIITGTPGTVWAGHDNERNELNLHVLDLEDEAVWVYKVKQHYERPLMEIFE